MSETVASPPIVPSSGTASGCGGGQGLRQSGSRGRGNRHGSRATTSPRVRTTFKGNTEEMNGHVFQCFNKYKDKRAFLEDCRSPWRIHRQEAQVPGQHGFPYERLRQARNSEAHGTRSF